MNQFYLFFLLFLLFLLCFKLQKRANRKKTIDHLVAIEDPIINMFKKGELRPIKESSAYHSPDMSETDEDHADGQRKIVTKDLEWRSTTVKIVKY